MPQRHQRLLTFGHVSTFETLVEARKLAAAVEETAAAGERLAVTSTRFGTGRPYRLELEWEYGWVKGGWPSDGDRFISRACKRAGVEPLSSDLRVLRESSGTRKPGPSSYGREEALQHPQRLLPLTLYAGERFRGLPDGGRPVDPPHQPAGTPDSSARWIGLPAVRIRLARRP